MGEIFHDDPSKYTYTISLVYSIPIFALYTDETQTVSVKFDHAVYIRGVNHMGYIFFFICESTKKPVHYAPALLYFRIYNIFFVFFLIIVFTFIDVLNLDILQAPKV